MKNVYFYTLTPNGSTVKADQFLSNFTSSVWTERYWTPGECNFVMDYVPGVENLLGALVTHTNTEVVMTIDSINVGPNDAGKKIATLNGRSFETFLGVRVHLPNTTSGFYDNVGGTDVAHEYTVNAGDDIAFRLADIYVKAMGHATGDNLDFANLAAGQLNPTVGGPNPVVPSGADAEAYYVQRGDAYTAMMSLMAMGDPKLVFKAAYNKTTKKIEFIVYTGSYSEVNLYADLGHLGNPSYLYSNLYANSASATAKYFTKYVSDSLTTGLARRYDYLNVGDFEAPNNALSQVYLQLQINKDLFANKKKALITGTINGEIIPYDFKTDYNVGDSAIVYGEGTVDIMRFSESVLTMDDDGLQHSLTLETW